jgi:hypothetical protein
VIWVGREEEYFFEKGWTGRPNHAVPLDKLLRARKARRMVGIAKPLKKINRREEA